MYQNALLVAHALVTPHLLLVVSSKAVKFLHNMATMPYV